MAIVINGSGTVTGLAVGGLPDGTVDDGTLASSAVTEAKIATDAVTAAKIATNSVDSAELVDGAVDDSHLANDALDSPAFIAKLQTATALSNITWTKVPLNLEPYDSDGCYDNATNYRFTPTKAGYYKVYGSVRVTATKVRAMYTSIYKNGSNVALRYKDFGTDASTITHLSNDVSALIPFNGTSDYIELYIWAQFNSASLHIQNASDTQLSAHWVRSL